MPITSQITFQGEPIAHGKVSKAIAFMQRPYIAGTAIGLAFNAAACVFAGSGLSVRDVCTTMAMPAFVGAAVSAGAFLGRKLDRLVVPLLSESETPKIIETEPKEGDLPNKEVWITLAQRKKKSAKKFFTVAAAHAVSYATFCVLVGGNENPLLWGFAGMGAFGAALVDEAATHYRWSKVENNEWLVKDPAPPERAQEKAKAPGFLKPAENLG